MAADYLHGVETIILEKGPVPIKVVKSSVITIVGIAPKGGDKNKPVLVVSDSDAAAFGKKIPGFTIAQALDAIRQYRAGTVFVVNVFDEDDHTTLVTRESQTIEDYEFRLDYPPVDVPKLINDIQVDYTIPADTTISIGDVVVVTGNIAAIALAAGTATEVIKARKTGTYSLPKVSGTVIAAGDTVYWNAGTSKVTVTNTDKALGKALTAAGNGTTTVTVELTATVVYESGVDYELDDFGNVKVLKPSVMAEDSKVLTTYKKLNSAAVTASVIVGEFDDDTNLRTGLKCLDLLLPLYGVTPKIIHCPGFNTLATVKAEMASKAAYWRAIYLLDAPTGTLPGAVYNARGPAGTIAISTTDKRAYICYPNYYIPDTDPTSAADAKVLRPYSENFAGIIAWTDLNLGYWVSPSNKNLLGILDAEIALTWSVNQSDTEVNILNSYGVGTFIKDGEFKSWGNRNASFPDKTGIGTFLSMQRLEDIVAESIEVFSKPYIDAPINDAIIDTITESVNAFFTKLKGQGAIVEGICFYDPNNNSSDDLANGNIKFEWEYVGGPPAERITFRSFRNIQFLNQLAA